MAVRDSNISSSSSSSPFDVFFNSLTALRAVGLPLALASHDPEGSGTARIVERHRLLKCIVFTTATLFVLQAGSVAVIANSFGVSHSWETTVALAEKHHLSTWDLNSLVLTGTVSLLVPVALFKAYKGVGDEMNELTAYLKAFGDVPAMGINLRHNYTYKITYFLEGALKATRRKVLVYYTAIFLRCLFMFPGSYILMGEYSVWTCISFAATQVAYLNFFTMPPVSAGNAGMSYLSASICCSSEANLALNHFLLATTNAAADQLLDQISSTSIKKNTSLTWLLRQSRILSEMTRCLDKILGPFLLILAAQFTSTAALGVFLSLSLLQMYDGVFKPVPFSYGWGNIMLGAVSVLILVDLMRQGQRLSNSFRYLGYSLLIETNKRCAYCRAIRDTLYDASIVHAQTMDPNEKAQMSALLSKYSVACPIRPMDVFNLNFAFGASIGGLVLTYIIVLVQFKLGER